MPNVSRLSSDSWNVAHIARHDVTPDEVEEACHGDPVVLQSYRGRLVLVGPTMAGKLLAAVLASEGEGTYYVVTARSGSRKERRYYEEQIGGATQ